MAPAPTSAPGNPDDTDSEEATDEEKGGLASGSSDENEEILDTWNQIHKTKAGDTMASIAAELDIPIKDLQDKTRLFVFDDDGLDSSEGFLNACQEAGGDGPKVSGLEGSHLGPVYINLNLDDLDLPDEARGIAGEMSGGFQGASFGDETVMQGAVNEVCNWVLGKQPTRPARSSATSDKATSVGQRRLAGGVIDAEIE